jgi:hypothetical protein
MNLFAVLLAIPPLFGVHLGDGPEAVKAKFKPEPAGVGQWNQSNDGAGERLDYVCAASAGCFALPGEATFRFVEGKLALAELRFEAQAAPPDASPAKHVAAAFQGLEPAARSQSVGRDSRYFVDADRTAVWTLDGLDAHVVLALDAQAPVTRAEAAAAGASAGALPSIPGAADYQKGHRAVFEKRLDDAVQAFESVLKTPKVPALLQEPARLLLALSLASRARVAGPSAAALADVKRARELAPDLAADLDELADYLKPAEAPPPAAQ